MPGAATAGNDAAEIYLARPGGESLEGELYVDARDSRVPHDIRVDYTGRFGGFVITDSQPLKTSSRRCRRPRPTRVFCDTYRGRRTELIIDGSHYRPNEITVGPTALGYRDIGTGGADDVVRAGRGSFGYVWLGKGDDQAFGGSGNEVIYGYGGGDVIYGGIGGDDIYPGIGQNALDGGPGDDDLYARNDVAEERIDCGAGKADLVKFDADLDPRPTRCEDQRPR